MNLWGGVLVSFDSLVLGRMTFERTSRNFVTLTRLLTSLSSDLVGVGARRAGQETETEEQAGAGHRHNGPDQLRTIQHLPLLLYFTSPLHLSLPPCSSHPTNETPTPQQYDRQTAKGLKQYTAKRGRGLAEMGGPMYTYKCVCVCLSAATYRVCVLASVWETGTLDIWTNMSTDSIWLLWMLVFVVLLDFIFIWRSDGQERHRNSGSLGRNAMHGVMSRLDQSVMSWWRMAL